MGVKVREWKGAWWLFINHNGQRKAKRVGVGDVGKKAARQAAGQIQARLALGEHGALQNAGTISLEQYAGTWLERIQHTRKHSTYDDYQKILKRDVLPMLGSLKLSHISREKVKDLAIAGLTWPCNGTAFTWKDGSSTCNATIPVERYAPPKAGNAAA
ncbi:tyrosine-type recombinase/integrase [Nitrospira sp. Nam74]